MMNAENRVKLLITLIFAGWVLINAVQTQAQGLTPEQAVNRMQVADGFNVLGSKRGH